MTEPKTAEQYAVAMQRDNSLTPMQWIRKAMLQAHLKACNDIADQIIDTGYAEVAFRVRDSKEEEDF